MGDMDSLRSNSRRQFIEYFAGIGLSSTLLPGVLWADMQQLKTQKITKEMLKNAEEIAGLNFTEAQREMMLAGVNQNLHMYDELRQVHLDVSVEPAVRFSPILPGMRFDTERHAFRMSAVSSLTRPADLQALAFWPVTHLSRLIQSHQLSSLELTKLYLDRLKKFNPVLKCAVTITEKLALEQARQADEEIAAGRYRGPLHGIPWGAKDLIAKQGYPTTWGAPPFRDRVIDTDATVVKRLEEAGAILIAKLATGELAHDDVWFGGQTKNPWDPGEGSGGSSAGPAAATAAGLVGFAVGTETGGSMIDPSIRCGVTSLRPTFGRVSRHGVMPGAWSFDKVGPMCRAVEDCAVVFNAIHGPDGLDLTVTDLNLPANAILATSVFPEICAVWDEMIRAGQDSQLTRQDPDHIGNACRTARFVPAVEYVQSSRARMLLMIAMAKIMAGLVAYVAPQSRIEDNSINPNLWVTNLTGHPAAVVPNGFIKHGKPTGITFVGNLYEEAKLLALAKAYQDATAFHLEHPTGFASYPAAAVDVMSETGLISSSLRTSQPSSSRRVNKCAT